jgi:dienelactone hydrolase
MSDAISHIEWLGEQNGSGYAERSFRLHRGTGQTPGVPGVLWAPRVAARPPAVLLFHGGSSHKRSERQLRMGRWFASTAGLAAIAIDGPYHGDRVPAPLAPAVYQQLIADEGIDRVTARITTEWLDTVSALADQGLADDGNVSVCGLSMGARFGLPAAAALGPRLRCAVLGKFGIRAAAPLPPGLSAPELIMAAAQAVSAPVHFHVQWDDALFPRDGQFELFEALGSADKRLWARPGPHGFTHRDDEASWRDFIARRGAP